MREPTFREVGDFQADSPDELTRSIVDLEDNVAAAFKQWLAYAAPILAPTTVKTAAYTANVWDLVVTDTSKGGFTITLPDASARNAGQVVAIARKSASNALLARAPSTNVQGAAPNTGDTVPASTGLYEYRSTGSEWWRR